MKILAMYGYFRDKELLINYFIEEKHLVKIKNFYKNKNLSDCAQDLKVHGFVSLAKNFRIKSVWYRK